MRYRLLGRTGVRVSEYMLGTMSYGSDGDTDEGECIRIVHSALDRGINFIDTANTYSHGQAEQIVGKAIAGRRDKIVLATKFRLPAGDGQNEQGGSSYCALALFAASSVICIYCLMSWSRLRHSEALSCGL